jgi:precorrin-6B methylase 2
LNAAIGFEGMAMKSDAVTSDRIKQLGEAFLGAKTLLSAVELGVFSVLAEGPLNSDALTTRIGIDARGARDFFDALVAVGMLDRQANHYENTAETGFYLDRNKPTYVGDLLESLNALFGLWASLTPALRTGKPQSGPRGTGNFPAFYADKVTRENFVRAMTARTLPAAKALAAKFPWASYNTLIDIGTAEGCLPIEIARVHPHITGGGFDLPQVSSLFDANVRKHTLENRLRFYAGDFFIDPMPAANVLVLSRVLNNWDHATQMMLLKKAYDALPLGGALIVQERLIDDERRLNTDGLLSSLNMLLITAGGHNFTGADCIGWMQNAGFRDLYIEPLTAEHSMVVGIK